MRYRAICLSANVSESVLYRGYHVTKKIWLEPIRMKAFVIDKPEAGGEI